MEVGHGDVRQMRYPNFTPADTVGKSDSLLGIAVVIEMVMLYFRALYRC
jgi:hypothetical protein